MKASALRIGNWVSNGDSSPAVQIRDGEDIDDHIDHDCYFPIPLTDDWLVKFGMTLYDGFSSTRFIYVNKHKYDTSIITYSPKEGMIRFSNGNSKGNSLIPHIKHVHQLQNLYFALTGEELEIKDYSGML